MQSVFSQLHTISEKVEIESAKPKPQPGRKSGDSSQRLTETDMLFFDALVSLGGEATTTEIKAKVVWEYDNSLKYLRKLESFKKVTSCKGQGKDIRARIITWKVVSTKETVDENTN